MIGRRVEQTIGARLAQRLFRPPRRPHHRDPSDLGLVATEATVHAADGTALHVWLIPVSRFLDQLEAVSAPGKV